MNFTTKICLAGLSIFAVACRANFTPVEGSTLSPVINTVSMNAVPKMKQTKACTTALPGLILWGDDMISASKKAGIKKVVFVDQEVSNFIIFAKVCNTYYGE